MKLVKSHLILSFAVLGLVACGSSTNLNNPPPGGGGGTPTPAPTPTPPGGSGTEVIGQPGLCTPGDVARVDFDDAGKTRFSLKIDDDPKIPCAAAKDNRLEEYTLIVYNTSGSPISFRIDSPINSSPITSLTTTLRAQGRDPINDPVNPPQSTGHYETGVTEVDRQAQNVNTSYRLAKRQKVYGTHGGLRGMSSSISINDEAEFRVRCDRSDPDIFCTTSAILLAQDTHINIFVDRDALSGNIDTLTSGQLATVVANYEGNIRPLAKKILADESDVDGDGRVSVLVTPILNRELTGFGKNFGVESYTDSRDLLPFNPVSNAGSNEGEIIYVAAPDSLGNYNLGGNGIDAATFVTKRLNAWIAFQLTHLISFNQHVFVSGGSAEDDWINDGMGAVFADLCGFNIFRSAAQFFLSNPQTDDLRKAEDLDLDDFEGAEYLFMLYLMQSQTNSTDANGDNIADGLRVFHSILTTGLTSTDGIEAAIKYSFDESVETEFQALFKDWTIAIVTSGTDRSDLQQSGVTALKYFFKINPTVLGSAILDASGSVRTGAVGNSVGFDLNKYSTEDFVLVENADEHVYAPGNSFFGYVDPFAAMYVRLGGLFASKQNISIKGSSANIRAFLVRRSNLDYITGSAYPKVYSESLTGSVEQHAEDLDAQGPNPYWPTRLDLTSLITSSGVVTGEISKEWLTVIGRIDTANPVLVCDSTGTIAGCKDTSVPDTDKYIFTVPDLGRGDEGDLAISVRRQFDNGKDTSALAPMLAIVSSKDVPYPYTPHPIRSAAVGGNGTRQQYRWMTSQLLCGDTEANLVTNTSDACNPGQAEDSIRVVVSNTSSGLVENTGSIPMIGGTWDGDIHSHTHAAGGECEDPPDQKLFDVPPLGVNTSGYAGEASTAVTAQEVSPSSMGQYGWSDSFMTMSYSGQAWPDVLYTREFLNPTTGYPSTDPQSVIYDPRALNGLTMNCHVDTGGTTPDETADSPDDFLEPSELTSPGSLAEQILVEMSRGRQTEGLLPAQYQDNDVFAIDGDSRDDDVECHTVDVGNNINTFTTRTGEGGLIWNSYSWLEPHISGNLSNSAISTTIDPSQGIYQNGGQFYVKLTPGKSYTIIVGGTGSSVGNYELRIRKINLGKILPNLFITPGNSDHCDFLL